MRNRFASQLFAVSFALALSAYERPIHALQCPCPKTVACSRVANRFRSRTDSPMTKPLPSSQMATITDEFFQRRSFNKAMGEPLCMTASQMPTSVTRKRVTMEGEPSPLPSMTDEEWKSHIRNSPEIDAIRKELIGRYARNGFDRRYATQQVEQFLLDPKQSVPFLEMRRFAEESKRSVYGDDGLTGDLTLVLATIVMLLGTFGVHLLGIYNDNL